MDQMHPFLRQMHPECPSSNGSKGNPTGDPYDRTDKSLLLGPTPGRFLLCRPRAMGSDRPFQLDEGVGCICREDIHMNQGWHAREGL